MSQTISMASFVAFINAQPAAREVNNYGWPTCMVGDYAREMHNHTVADWHGQEDDPVLCALWKGCGYSDDAELAEHWKVEFRENAPKSFMDMLEYGEFDTYGQAQQYLINNPQ